MIPEIAVITAPNVAPEVIPMIPGSAREFLKNIWNVEPHKASTEPVMTQSNVRGSLKFMIKDLKSRISSTLKNSEIKTEMIKIIISNKGDSFFILWVQF